MSTPASSAGTYLPPTPGQLSTAHTSLASEQCVQWQVLPLALALLHPVSNTQATQLWPSFTSIIKASSAASHHRGTMSASEGRVVSTFMWCSPFCSVSTGLAVTHTTATTHTASSTTHTTPTTVAVFLFSCIPTACLLKTKLF